MTITTNQNNTILRTGRGDLPEHAGAYRYTLDPALFFKQDAATRRRALFKLAAVPMKPTAIAKLLKEKGYPDESVDRCCAVLDNSKSFEAAVKCAQSIATEQRGVWKQITGDTYGDIKGATWKPNEAAKPDGDVDQLRAERVLAIAKYEKNEADRRKYDAELAAYNAAQAIVTKGGDVKTLEKALKTAQDAAAAQKTKVGELARASKPVAAGSAEAEAGRWECPCPHCGVLLTDTGTDNSLVIAPAPASDEDKAARAAAKQAYADLVAATGVQETLDKAVTKAQEALANARAAAAVAKKMPQKPDEQTARDLDALKTLLDTEIKLLDDGLEDWRLYESTNQFRDKRTADALAAHEAVQANSKLADAIEALPAQFLDSTLARVNELLAQFGKVFGQPIVLGADMEPRFGTFGYWTCSRSQQLRIELAFAYVVSKLTGAGVIMLDEFDLISAHRRPAVLGWASKQTDVQTILLATYKEKPTKFPPTMAVLWLEGGA